MAIGHIAPGGVMPHLNTTGAPIAVNTVIDFADMIGIALGTIPDGGVGQLAIGEVWTLPKDDNLVIDQGDQVYWDAVNGEVDRTDTNTPCGKAYADAALADTEIAIILNM